MTLNRSQILTASMLVLVAFLAWYSAGLAAIRLYQVDECQNIYMARILATGQTHEFFTNASLFLFGPLSWITRHATQSTEVFNTARLLFLGVFWLNLCLLAGIASGRLLSTRGLIALAAAASLAPLWDYGFEIRHDNLVLTGVLVTWWTVRVRPKGLFSYVLAGAIAPALLFLAVKSVVYVLPLSLAILAFPPVEHGQGRLRLAGAWAVGAVLAVLLIRLVYGANGLWEIYLSVFSGVTQYSAHKDGSDAASHFWPWATLGRLLAQTPLLVALATAGMISAIGVLVRRGRVALNWNGLLPEVLLCVGALAAVLVNPTPFPYNLVHVVPYGFILAFRYGSGLGADLWACRGLRPVLVTVLVFAHVVPFTTATLRHSNFTNFRQERLMRLAEDLTDPTKDAVYDGAGLVPTRRSIHFQWYLHSTIIQKFIDGPFPSIREQLSARPAPVFIPNYRTDWLPEADREFVRGHYVSLADDFWVLGALLPEGGGTFKTTYPGRYRISSVEGSDLAGTYPEGLEGMRTPEAPGVLAAKLDGEPLARQTIDLAAGQHRIESPPDRKVAVVWTGPKLERIHRVAPGDHRWLFVNWY